jgi:hypothetical protein
MPEWQHHKRTTFLRLFDKTSDHRLVDRFMASDR